MHKLVFALFAFAAILANAEMRTVTGYGTGDTLDQALIMAQSDAVLNAGGRVATIEQVHGDVLVSDKGVSSNVLFVSEYKILDKGESFDGVSARIEAKVCNVSDRKFENGKYVLGEGEGATARTARVAAIGNAICSLGVEVKAVGEYDKDVLIKDETDVVGWAFVTDIEEVDCAFENGKYKSRIKIKVFASKADSGIDRSFSKETAGSGASFFEAVNKARTKAVFDLDSTYSVKAIYESGELVSRYIKHDWHGFCYGTEIVHKNQAGNTWDVNVRINFDENENSHRADGVSSASGFGLAGNQDDAIEDARRDAVVNAGSMADISVYYEEGKEVVEQSKFKAQAYIGLQTADVRPSGEDVSAHIVAKVSRDRKSDSECMLAHAVARECDKSAYRAYLVARFKSLIAAGALYYVERVYGGNAILSDMCSVTSVRANCGFAIDAPLDSNGIESRTVQVQTYGLPAGAVVSDTVLGVGCGKTEDTAFELAKNDAVVNACSKVVAKGNYDKTELKEFEQLFVGNAFIGCVTVDSSENCAEGQLLRVMASVSGSPESVKAIPPSRVDCEANATSADAAIALARRGLLMKSGAMAKVRMMYKGTDLRQSDAEYSAKGTLSDCKMQVSRDSQNSYSVHASGHIAESNSAQGEKAVEGYGSGSNFQAAMEAAVANAILNCGGKISGEERYEMGVCQGGNSTCNAEGFLFKTELVQFLKDGGDSFVQVHCSFANEDGKLSGAKEKVDSIGWGESVESAKLAAERNAIDSVFGRKICSAISERNGEVTSKHFTEQGFEDGYVEDTKVLETKMENGLYTVKIKTVVRQRGVEEPSFIGGLIGWVVVFFILSAIIYGAKEKGGKVLAIIASLIIVSAVFANGHWIMGIVMSVSGLGIICNND